jgi:YesN/AraC family two-component response regulator
MRYQSEREDSALLRKDITRHTFLSLMFELAALYRKYNVSKNPNVSRKEELTLRFVQMVSAHFREQRSVQFYADQLFVTAKYLSVAVKEVTSKSSGAVIDEAVVSEAKILLSNPSSTIAEIAEALNFSDQSFFGKYFKKHSGYSPSEYRQQYWAH